MINFKHFAYLTAIILLLSIVRWNRQDLFISNYVGDDALNLGEKIDYDVKINIDSYNYLQYVNYYRGQDVEDEVTKPYSFRFLSPLLASILPFDSFSSLNIINLSSEILTLLFLMKILAMFGYRDKTILLTSLIFAFSFPVFYYGVTGLVDPPAIFLITLGIYYTLSNKTIPIYIVLIVGAMVNEKVILLLPFYFFFNFKINGFKKSFIQSTMMFLMFLITSLLVREYTLNADSTFLWSASTESLMFNLSRVRTYLSLLLTGGLPLLFLLIAINSIDFSVPRNFAFLMGVIFVILLILYSFAAAYTDGRFMWYIYPFALPLCAVAIERYSFRKSK